MRDESPKSMRVANGQRKEDHLRIVLNERVRFDAVSTGFENYEFVHQALPELDKNEVDISHDLLGKRLRAPLVLSSMVGGIEAAVEINRNLARAAQALGLAMGLGSQRCAVDDSELCYTYKVRDVAPDILLFANLGAVQLNYGYGVAECERAVEMVQADALILHLNPLQEALQPEGNTNFGGLLRKMEDVCRRLPVPVIVKEVGWGISEDVARKLRDAGVSAIDTAGAGGTSWSEVERHRTTSDLDDGIASTFASWGIPTAESIAWVRMGAPGLPLVASGGIRSGVDVAKAIALGADAAGLAAPLLKAAVTSTEDVIVVLRRVIEELRLAMFCIGAASLADLRLSPLLRKKSQ